MTINLQEALLLSVSTLTVLAGATIAPSLPFIADHFAHSAHNDFWAQLALALPGIFVAISAGWMGKQASGRYLPSTLLIALITYGGFGVSYLLAPQSLALLLVSRAALGFCVAAIMIVTTIMLIRGKTPQKCGQLLGYQAAAGGFGGVLYMAFANELTQWHGLAPFSLYAIAWIFALLLWRANKHTHSTLPVSRQAKIPPSNSNLLARAEPFLLFAILATLEMLVLYALVLQVPLLAIASPYLLSGALTLALLAMATTSAFYVHLQQLLSITLQHLLGLLFIATGFATLAISSEAISLLGFVITLCGIGAGIGMLRPNLVAWLFSGKAAAERPAAMGKLTAVFFSAQFLAPFIVYPLAHYAGTRFLWSTFSLMTFIAAGYLFILHLSCRNRYKTVA